MAILFALLALVGWASGDIFIAKATRKFGRYEALFLWLFFYLAVSSFYLPWAGPVADVGYFVLSFFINLIGTLGTLFYIMAFEKGNVSLTGTIGAAFPVVTIPLSIILFSERLTAYQTGAIIIIITGLVLATYNPEGLKGNKIWKILGGRSTKLAFAAMLLWGVYWAVIRYPIEKIGWFWAGYPTGFNFILLMLLGWVRKFPVGHIRDGKSLAIIILMSGLTALGSFSYNIGLTYGYSSIVAPVAGASPVLFVILSRMFFHEKLTDRQKAGIAVTLMGIVAVGLSSV